MATGKKSFLLYCDIIHTVEQLTDAEAGELFKHILRYVNDQNPIAPSTITRIAFEPIKQSLKRDLDRYESICKRNSDNAKKRWDATASDRIPNDAKHADNDSDSDSDIDIKDIYKQQKGFKKPSVQQIKEYMMELGMPDYSERFYDYYTANGWKVGRNAMKDWKAAVRNWRKNNTTQTTYVPNKPKIATL